VCNSRRRFCVCIATDEVRARFAEQDEGNMRNCRAR
jgi:hypothetical protein